LIPQTPHAGWRAIGHLRGIGIPGERGVRRWSRSVGWRAMCHALQHLGRVTALGDAGGILPGDGDSRRLRLAWSAK